MCIIHAETNIDKEIRKTKRNELNQIIILLTPFPAVTIISN